MSEIGGLDGWVGAHHVGRALGQLAALMHHDDMVGQAHDEADIVLEPSRRDSGPAVAVSAVLAAQRDRELAVARGVHPAGRAGVAATVEPLEFGDERHGGVPGSPAHRRRRV